MPEESTAIRKLVDQLRPMVSSRGLVAVSVEPRYTSALTTAILRLLSGELGLPGIILCADHPYTVYRETLHAAGVPTDRLTFIDIIRPGKTMAEADNVLFVGFPLKLGELPVVVEAAAAGLASPGETPFLHLDSLRALQTYSDTDTPEALEEFLRALKGLGLLTVAIIEEGMKHSDRAASACDRTLKGFALKRGHATLVEERKPVHAFQLFRDLVGHGVPGLCITRMLPQELRGEHGLRDTPIVLLARETAEASIPVVRRMEEIAGHIERFMKQNPDCVVLLDGLEYLITQFDFPLVLRFSHDLNKTVALTHSRLLIPLDPRTLEEKELAFLERDMEVLTPDSG